MADGPMLVIYPRLVFVDVGANGIPVDLFDESEDKKYIFQKQSKLS